MLSISKGTLSISSDHLDNIKDRIDKGISPKEALITELEENKLKFKNVGDIELTGSLMQNKEYVELYCKIVADCWNSK